MTPDESEIEAQALYARSGLCAETRGWQHISEDDREHFRERVRREGASDAVAETQYELVGWMDDAPSEQAFHRHWKDTEVLPVCPRIEGMDCPSCYPVFRRVGEREAQ